LNRGVLELVVLEQSNFGGIKVQFNVVSSEERLSKDEYLFAVCTDKSLASATGEVIDKILLGRK